MENTGGKYRIQMIKSYTFNEVNSWERMGSRQTVFHIYIYRALMRSAIDYGCLVYGAAAKMHLNKIDRAINKALRICTGTMRTSPIKALHIELGEVPIELRGDKILLEYWSRLKGCGYENPAKNVIQEC